VDQGHYLALPQGQLSDPRTHLVHQLLLPLVVSRRARARQNDIIDVSHFPTGPKVVFPAIGQDPKQPGFERLPLLQLVPLGQGLGQSLLNQIVSQRRIVTPVLGNSVKLIALFRQLAPHSVRGH
jgi:hypothetical protein